MNERYKKIIAKSVCTQAMTIDSKQLIESAVNFADALENVAVSLRNDIHLGVLTHDKHAHIQLQPLANSVGKSYVDIISASQRFIDDITETVDGD